MDAGILKDKDGVLWVREGRRLKKGDLVAVGEKEDGSDFTDADEQSVLVLAELASLAIDHASRTKELSRRQAHSAERVRPS